MLKIGIRSIALAYPEEVRTNDWFRQRAPDVYANAEERTLASVFKPDLDDPDTALMDECMAPYLKDPFRGTVERRILGEEQRSIDLISDAVAKAITAAGLERSDIDLLIVTSFWPHHPATGDATWVAEALDLEAQVINLEATCAGTMMALQTASAMIEAGLARNVVVATGCSYSTTFDLRDSLCWFMGDGAGAMVLSTARGEEGLVAFHALNTRSTCGAFRIDLESDAEGVVHRYMRPGYINTGRALRANAHPNLQTCTREALAKAGLGLDEIDAFVINTPVAWFQEFAARAWGIDKERIVSLHSEFANTGPVLTMTNLYFSVARGLLSPGDRVLVYAFGSVSNATAAVLRWGDTALAPFELCGATELLDGVELRY